MHHYHLRLTPSALKEPITDLSGWLIGAHKWVIAAEKGSKTQKPHLHFYIESDDCMATIRNKIRSAYRLTVGQKGKANSEYCLKGDCYKDPSPAYVVKDNVIVDYRGISKEELEEYVRSGSARWGVGRFQDMLDAFDLQGDSPGKDQEEEEVELRVRTTPATPPVPRSEWDSLLTSYKLDPKATTRTMPMIQQWIKSYYLTRSRPIPRAGDLRRYAYSMWAILHDKVTEEDVYEADVHERSYLPDNVI